MTPQEFISTWKNNALNEKSGAQSYFGHLCRLLKVDEPLKKGEYQYEYSGKKNIGGKGFADVWKDGYFGWENKKPKGNLSDALNQLRNYEDLLNYPPLLVVSDREKIVIHKRFNGYPDEPTTILIDDLVDPKNIQLLRYVFEDPEKLRPKKSTAAITEDAAGKFADIAEAMRKRNVGPQVVAHFLIQCVFCMFAEDEGILPNSVFSNLLAKAKYDPSRAAKKLADLFVVMRKGGDYGDEAIDHFNGGLFNVIDVPELTKGELKTLADAAIDMDWRAIEPAILGTLFERGLNPSKRGQLGAHYTDQETIMRIIDPVIRMPLMSEWESIRSEIERLSPKFGYTGKNKKVPNAQRKHAMDLFHGFLDRLRKFRVLDPACGSGNFLYLSLKTLKDIEKQANLDAERLGLQRQVSIECSPANVMGIEIDPYAAELARVTVWIGELQWMLQNGYDYNKKPILKSLENIENRDALINESGNESIWPSADAIVGNPPFLGDRKMIRGLGEQYTGAIRELYSGKVPGGADLVCYWFHKSREQILANKAHCAGLVSTNSIRGGANRAVLDAIARDLVIFNAWSDEDWINEGAAVRVSLVSFASTCITKSWIRLDGKSVEKINPDLTPSNASNSFDLTKAVKLAENIGASFIGTQKNGPFDIQGDVARAWLSLPNPNNRPSSDVVRPWANGMDITRRPSDTWVIDFDKITEAEAALYEKPFEHVVTKVKPTRLDLRRDWHRIYWWCHGDPRPAMKRGLANVSRCILSPRVSKHRVFHWASSKTIPDSAVVAITRSDDATFGILHSRFHEIWSLRLCTYLGVGNDPRYTPTTCFETFPFPSGMTPADTKSCAPSSDEAKAIADAAMSLNQLRDTWLNPPDWVDWVITPEEEKAGFPLRPVAKAGRENDLKKRTLTNLYNERPPWLKMAHEKLDVAVAAAYGWNDYTPDMSDDEILKRLLALNLERAAKQ